MINASVKKVIDMMHKCRSCDLLDKLVNHYVEDCLPRSKMKEFGQYFAKQSLNSLF